MNDSESTHCINVDKCGFQFSENVVHTYNIINAYEQTDMELEQEE